MILAATPLGRPGDASPRLRERSAAAPVIAAEDTRRLRRLCADLQVRPVGRVVSFYDANESVRVPQPARRRCAPARTCWWSPTPACPPCRTRATGWWRPRSAAGIAVTVLPGPSAVTTALAISGLPSTGSASRASCRAKPGERRRALAALAGEQRTLVFFEAPHRLAAQPADLAAAFGADRPAAVCRELTKTHEEVRRGPLGELAEWATREPVRGEITLVVGGAPAVSDRDPASSPRGRGARGGRAHPQGRDRRCRPSPRRPEADGLRGRDRREGNRTLRPLSGRFCVEWSRIR